MATKNVEHKKKIFFFLPTTITATENQQNTTEAKIELCGFCVSFCSRDKINGCTPHPIHVPKKIYHSNNTALLLKEQRKQRKKGNKYICIHSINWICSVYLLMRLEFNIHEWIRRAPKILCTVCLVHVMSVLPPKSQESKYQQHSIRIHTNTNERNSVCVHTYTTGFECIHVCAPAHVHSRYWHWIC